MNIEETINNFKEDWNGGVFWSREKEHNDPERIEDFIRSALEQQADEFRRLIESKKALLDAATIQEGRTPCYHLDNADKAFKELLEE